MAAKTTLILAATIAVVGLALWTGKPGRALPIVGVTTAAFVVLLGVLFGASAIMGR